ncbi:MAG: hypothetical protein K9G60_13340 [Pseudolabrys sp.]|nr:hypothetical protein [Pseudolabrys sp.]
MNYLGGEQIVPVTRARIAAQAAKICSAPLTAASQAKLKTFKAAGE